MTWRYLVLAAWVILVGSLPAYAAAANRDLERIPFNLGFLFVVAIVLVVMGDKAMLMGSDRRLRAARRIKFIFGMPLCWLVLSLIHAETGYLAANWIALPMWGLLVALMFAFGQNLVPGPLRRWFASMYPDDTPTTHGSAHFGTAAIGARHLAPAAPADAFVLGYLPGAPRKGDGPISGRMGIFSHAPPTGRRQGRGWRHPEPAGLSRLRLRAGLQGRELRRPPPARAASLGTKSSWSIRSASPATPGTR